jgi:chromatin assembly factor 1 subunit A
MKLNAFFTKPKPVPDKSAKAMVDKVQNPATGPISLPPQSTFTCSNAAPPSPQKAMQSNAKSDYDRFFLPFSAPPHTIIAPYNAFMDDPEKLAASYGRMEKLLGQEAVEMEPITLETFRSIFPKRRRGLDTPTIGEIIDLVNESADNPIDLTGEEDLKQQKPLEMLKQIPMKYLRFDEDVRPPYYGTYTKPHRLSEEGKLARNPFSRGLDDLNYDYDSEAEWEEPEEGEDLDSEGEEDLDEDGDEDMDGFLDDDEDPDIKRRLLNGDQEPVSTGLCWENEDRVSILNDGSGAICTDFRDFKMGFLLGTSL